MKLKFIIFALFLSIPLVYGAEISGKIYDSDLSLAKNAIVTVDSIPKQTIVANDGHFTFSLSKGEYVISVLYTSDYQKYVAEEPIAIVSGGNFVFDIILLPDLSEEEILLDEELVEPNLYAQANYWYGIVILIMILGLFYFFKRKKQNSYEGDESDEIIAFIKKEGRVLQKTLRKQFPMSEAKMSLLLSELESKGKIKKIKRGKGNMIVLSKTS